MAAQEYFNSSTWDDNRRRDYDAPLPPIPPSSSSKPSASSPFEDTAYPAHQPYESHPAYNRYGRDSPEYASNSHSDPFADDIPLKSQQSHVSTTPETSPSHPEYRSDFERGSTLPPTDPVEEPRRHRSKSKKFLSNVPWFVYTVTLIQVAVFIAELARNAALTGSPIEIKPQFNPFIGPSFFVQVNMGALFQPCMRNIDGLQGWGANYANLSLPCPGTTSLDPTVQPNGCSLTELCGLSYVPPVNQGPSKPGQPAPNQWYRFIIPIFLHGGIVHIGLNLAVQILIGKEWERMIGTLRFALVYLSSGIFGFVMSGNYAGTSTASTGASGSLFGIIALMVLDLFYNWSQTESPVKEVIVIVLCIGISFVLGLLPGVDNFAHIGGFLMGLVLGICILRSPAALSARTGENEPPYKPVTTTRRTLKQSAIGLRNFAKQPAGFFKGRKPLWWAWWLIRAAALIAVLVGFIVLLKSFYSGKRTCKWCKYLSCLPVNDWCKQEELSFAYLQDKPTLTTGIVRPTPA
ncbi:MAG: hypothetical protein M1825_003276 [Sarcosagium campestre]|nr:MAG: hypothetical protein M1825_003276 [Sarcosagium campestre]